MDDRERMLHELRTHQIELESQNEELRAAQQRLDASRARYFDLYDLAPVGYCTVSELDVILEANLTAASFVARARADMAGRSCSEFIFPEDQDVYYLMRKRLFASDEPQSIELRMVGKDGVPVWTRMQAVTAAEEDGTRVCRAVLIDISERKSAQEKICELLAEKDLILKETHHRVKNNMLMIAGMLQLQAGREECGGTCDALIDAAQRIQSMIILYDHLYRSETHASLSLRPFLESLVAQIRGVFCPIFPVDIRIAVEEFALDPKKILPIGILANELITNSLKYAFKGRETGSISILVRRDGARAVLEYSDTGIGLPDGVSCEESPGFGMKLVGMLALQLRGELRTERASGTKFILEFEA